MKKWLYKILMLVAVVTVAGHNAMPHHHHPDIQAVAHHNGHNEDHDADHHERQSKEEHHNIFSFAQIEEDFLPSQFSNANVELPVLYLLTPVISFHIDDLEAQSKIHFGYYREFPPPKDYFSYLFSRPPPAC